MSNKLNPIPFNDLTRIHLPLLDEFKDNLGRLVTNSSLVLGEEVALFENELAVAEGCRYVVGVNSGTTAIELALRALGVGEGDEVITTAFTFVATCFAIIQTGATPVLVDINPLSGLMNPDLLEKVITPRTKAVVFVTLHGRVENLEEIQSFCHRNNLYFVIDAAQSHLGVFNGEPQTNFCDVATLSFYPGKNLGALGEGGAVLTNSPEVRNRIAIMRDWGAEEKYNHVYWGGNFRLESLQASFLRTKLRHLLSWTKERQEIAKLYTGKLQPNLLMNEVSSGGSHVYHIFAIQSNQRSVIVDLLNREGIGYGFHYPRAIHQQPAYLGRIKTPIELGYSEWLANTTLSIPLFPCQTPAEIDSVIRVLNSNIT